MDVKIIELLSAARDVESQWKPKSGRDLTEDEKLGWVSTLQISKAVVGPKGTTTIVNPALYALEKQKKIEKASEANGADPRWRFVSVPEKIESCYPYRSESTDEN